jgi:hypothetical protein
MLQPKLKIGAPGDRFEREADAVADRVMRMSDGESLRMQPLEEEEETMQMQPLEAEEEMMQPRLQMQPEIRMQCLTCQQDEGQRIQTKKSDGHMSPVIQRSGDGALYADASFSNRLQSRRGLGQPLPESVHKELGGKFGADFSGVRVHTDSHAIQMNRDIGAQAFTYGSDVYFNKGNYDPSGTGGKHLLAHELTHVVQQGGWQDRIQRSCGTQAIGAPQGCTQGPPVFIPGALFRFNNACDDFAPGQEQALLQFASTLSANDVIEIHGFASVSGSADFNRNLSCARAIRARELLATQGGIQRARIVAVLNHGPTPGAEADRRSVVILSRARSGPTALDFVVQSVTPTPGRLDDPDQTMSPGVVSWDLSFAVPSPITAEAVVDVNGSAGDPCAQYQVGYLQTVYQQWLVIHYSGQHPNHGQTVIRYMVTLPVRDGDPNTMWYEPSSPGAVSPAGCNTRLNPNPLMDDYPTIFNLSKVHQNSVRGQSNYLDNVSRGIFFVTTLVASGPGGVIPLRHFFWHYLMDINFTPNYTNTNGAWPFQWNLNNAVPGPILNGSASVVPLFTTPSGTYNQSLTPSPPVET